MYFEFLSAPLNTQKIKSLIYENKRGLLNRTFHWLLLFDVMALVFTCHLYRFAVWFSSVLPNKRWIIVGRLPRSRLLVSGCIHDQQFGLLVVADKFSELLLHSPRLHPSTQPAQCPLCLIYPSFGNQPYRGLWHLRGAHYL